MTIRHTFINWNLSILAVSKSHAVISNEQWSYIVSWSTDIYCDTTKNDTLVPGKYIEMCRCVHLVFPLIWFALPCPAQSTIPGLYNIVIYDFLNLSKRKSTNYEINLNFNSFYKFDH